MLNQAQLLAPVALCVASAIPAQLVPVENFSFEEGLIESNLTSETLEGWSVGGLPGDAAGCTVDAIQDPFIQPTEAPDGSTGLDLNGQTNCSISQSIPTQAGFEYQIGFFYGDLWKTSSIGRGLFGDTPGDATFDVLADGMILASVTIPENVGAFGNDRLSVTNEGDFVLGTVNFVASGTQTVISFQSTTTGTNGSTALDLIVVTEIGSPEPCLGDANGDKTVNVTDFIEVLLNFGSTGLDIPGDANDDEVVNVSDFIAVLLNFGSVC